MGHGIEEVTRGAEFMDNLRPGWYREIDRDALDIGSGRCCIGGQMEGDYAIFAKKHHLKNASELGFTVRDDEEAIPKFNELTQAWLNAIDERLDFDAEVAALSDTREVVHA